MAAGIPANRLEDRVEPVIEAGYRFSARGRTPASRPCQRPPSTPPLQTASPHHAPHLTSPRSPARPPAEFCTSKSLKRDWSNATLVRPRRHNFRRPWCLRLGLVTSKATLSGGESAGPSSSPWTRRPVRRRPRRRGEPAALRDALACRDLGRQPRTPVTPRRWRDGSRWVVKWPEGNRGGPPSAG